MGRVLAVLSALALFASITIGTYFFLASRPSSGREARDGFDLGAVAEGERRTGERDPVQSSPNPLIGDDDPDPEPVEAPAAAPRVARAPGAPGTPLASGGGEPPVAEPATAERRREKEFLKAHGADLARYRAGTFQRVAMAQFKANPAVRDMDRAFAGMPRYMAVKKRFDRDGDPFQFARDAVVLPEVRAEIMRRAADPLFWKAAFSVCCDSLKEPPPPAVLAEAKRFLANDSTVSEFVGDFAGAASSNAGAMAKGIPPGMDLAPVRALASEVAPGAAIPPLPPAPR